MTVISTLKPVSAHCEPENGPVVYDGIFLHGRNQDARFAAQIAAKLMLDTVRWLTPQAALGSWYQERFDAPIASNAAQVATAFAQIDDLIDQCDRPIVLAGFSQGACLAAEYVLQSRKTVTALIALTGSRLGSPDEYAIPQGLDGLPVILTGGETDEWVPEADIRATAQAFDDAGATTDCQIFADKPHGISDEEIAHVRSAFLAMTSRKAGAA